MTERERERNCLSRMKAHILLVALSDTLPGRLAMSDYIGAFFHDIPGDWRLLMGNPSTHAVLEFIYPSWDCSFLIGSSVIQQ